MSVVSADLLPPPLPPPEASIAEAFATVDARMGAWSHAVQEAVAVLAAREERQAEYARRVIGYAAALRGVLDRMRTRMSEARSAPQRAERCPDDHDGESRALNDAR
ncbi:MAG TPA: hypothetical protein PKK06_04300 [Phycisphaerae bacterium]|nr:hypothetical protein [Phycisphaerae bacterium]HNU46189.1 hypothetical protein [Phycisphaerae bacterium]